MLSHERHYFIKKNSLLCISKANISKLQLVQNSLARAITYTKNLTTLLLCLNFCTGFRLNSESSSRLGCLYLKLSVMTNHLIYALNFPFKTIPMQLDLL